MYTIGIINGTDNDLTKASTDPNCSNAKECLEELEKRKQREESRRAKVRERLASNPFDPRNEVSADARHISGRIVKHLWIIFILIPTFFAILLIALK